MTLIQKIKETDIKVSYIFPKLYHHKFLCKTMTLITGVGDFGMIWLFLIFILSLNNKTQLLAQKMLAALLLSTIISQVIIKSIVKRKRPCQTYSNIKMLIAIPSDYSFPSGHTASSFACATAICFFFPKTGILFILFAFLISFSRLFLFVHYLSDVIFGIILGILVGILVMIF